MVRAVGFFNEVNPGTAVGTSGCNPAGNRFTENNGTAAPRRRLRVTGYRLQQGRESVESARSLDLYNLQRSKANCQKLGISGRMFCEDSTNDAAGNRVAQVTPTETTYYSWDAAGNMATAEPAAGIVTLTYNADQQRAVKQSTDGAVTGFLYDYKRLLCETDTVGGAISQTYASDTTDEFGDLIGEDGQYIHQYDAQANTNALLDETGTVAAQYKYCPGPADCEGAKFHDKV